MPASKLPQAKVYGGVGSILVLLAVIPYVGFVLAVIGLVFILISLKYISDEVGEPKIFRYALYSFIAGVVGAVIMTFVVLSVFMAAIFMPAMPAPPITVIGPTTIPHNGMQQGWMYGDGFIGIVIAMLGFLIAVWVSQIISAIFLKTSYDAVAKHLGVGLFSTVAILYIVGAVLIIIFVGLLIIFVALIIQVVAFFSIPETRPQTPQGQPPSSPQ